MHSRERPCCVKLRSRMHLVIRRRRQCHRGTPKVVRLDPLEEIHISEFFHLLHISLCLDDFLVIEQNPCVLLFVC